RRGGAVWIAGASHASDAPVWLTLDGKSTPAAIPAASFQLELARDDRRVALSVGGVPGSPNSAGRDIWIADLERGTMARLSINEKADSRTWTPDGQRVAYRRVTRPTDVGNESEQIVMRPADGSGEARVIYEEKDVPLGTSVFSPDGRYLVFGRRQRAD